MPSFSEFSSTPGSNASAGGTNIAENCPAANVNDVIRYIMACGRALYDTVAALDISGLMPTSGGAFTAQISLKGGGGYLYNASSAQTGGAVYVLPSGTALPTSPAEGTFVFFY